MKFLQHSGIPVWVLFLEPWRCQKCRPGAIRNFIKGTGFPLLDFSVRGTKGLSKAYADRYRKVSNPLPFVFYSLQTTHSRFVKWETNVPKNPAILALLLGIVPRNSHYLTCILQWVIWQDCRKHQRSSRGACGGSAWFVDINRRLIHRSRLEEKHLASEFRFRPSGCDLHCGLFVLFHSRVYCGSTAYFWIQRQTVSNNEQSILRT